jgi:hypothetical protein
MHVDFFINTNNWCGQIDGSANDDDDCHNAIIDILTKHNPANHTIHHVHMGTASTVPPPQKPDDPSPDGCGDATSCDAEVAGVEKVIDTMSAHGRPHLTRFRAPYGEPYQTADATKLGIVAPVVAKYAVEVDWNLMMGDADCNDLATCTYTPDLMVTNVLNAVGAGPGKGSWGILLMHTTYKWTYGAIQKLFGPNGELAKRGFKTATVEDAICWKYGMHSWDIVNKLNSGAGRTKN